MPMMKCKSCKQKISTKTTTCPYCGHDYQAENEQHQQQALKEQIRFASGPSKGVAVILALLLGGIGIHMFYINKPIWGIIFLLFCWTFIPAILGLLQGIIWLFTSEKAFRLAHSPKI